MQSKEMNAGARLFLISLVTYTGDLVSSLEAEEDCNHLGTGREVYWFTQSLETTSCRTKMALHPELVLCRYVGVVLPAEDLMMSWFTVFMIVFIIMSS